MTTHETDRQADQDAGAEDEAMPGIDEPTAERDELGTDPDERYDAGEDETGTSGLEAEEPVEAQDPIVDPVQKLAPVDPETALDPGAGRYDDRWAAIQAGFIDDPRRTVESASALVAEIWDETARTLADERQDVEDRWQSAESSTDDLRVAMQDYRGLYARYVGFTSA